MLRVAPCRGATGGLRNFYLSGPTPFVLASAILSRSVQISTLHDKISRAETGTADKASSGRHWLCCY